MIIALILAPFALLTFCFAIELFVGLRPLRPVDAPPAIDVSAVIVVPAHDEEPIIADTLTRLKGAAADRARILVVADNCTDSTAAAARSTGVEVIERVDPKRRGKGFALDFARLHLRSAPPDIVLVIDADCTVDSATIERLIAHCSASGRPCQAIDLQLPAPNAPPTMQLSIFAFYVRNVVRQRALQRLAGRVHLLGTGMALPWRLFDRAGLATDNIVEDLDLGIQLAQSGNPARLIEDTAVWSEAAPQDGALDQRRRWEGGYLQSAMKWAPRMLSLKLRRAEMRGVWSGVSLLIPPFALLLLIDVLLLIFSALALLLTRASPWPALCLAFVVALAGIGLLLAWALGGSRFASGGALLRAPLYILWKLPIYAGIARRGAPKEWLRTGRG